ncbi:exonuclease domain-containing protein [Aestuariibaculum sp. M13]|uniref:exonuclease domain-containing protein n=1 Tax=Aestuariibaculum sp. M13 TaxID=2967132 RepID=UPI002159FB61|nr:exonuclease domain-containing protein [Aestuariibaculum sp. M13]MCR8668247.1 exonuclease domain-containing protein [Aestuariibaculum sp. M13]
MIYTIIDIETTGQGNKITEISIFKYDGDKVIDEFTSLVNPESYIPDYITALTGIDNYMVADAPTFKDVADNILSITEDCIFVAHNVNFDYNIIRSEFKAIGVDFNRRKLCTIRLARKLIPGHPSYSLGKLCTSLDIIIEDRHRARGDAQATVILFKQILDSENSEQVVLEFLKKSSKEATLPPHLPSTVFNGIPNAPGIYYFKNKKGKIIYVGKAKDLKKRVLGHFYDKSDKELALCRETADIDYELSGGELIALLMEDAAIKQHYPEYNVASKRNPKVYGIFTYEDRDGVIHMAYNTLQNTVAPFITFYNITDCRTFLEKLCMQFELCPKYCHLQEGVTYCNHYKIHTCHGICKNEESVDTYNQRVHEALEYTNSNTLNKVIKQPGRHSEEQAFIQIQNGVYLGYGFIETSHQITNSESLENYLIPQKDNVDVKKILRKHLM